MVKKRSFLKKNFFEATGAGELSKIMAPRKGRTAVLYMKRNSIGKTYFPYLNGVIFMGYLGKRAPGAALSTISVRAHRIGLGDELSLFIVELDVI